MRDSATNTKSKFGSWRQSDPKHIADEIKSRRLYNETRGTKFESDTVVVKNKHVASSIDPQDPRQTTQSTMGLFGSSTSRGSSAKSSSFFKRLVDDAESGRNPYAANGSNGAAGSSSWVKGMSSDVSPDKRASLEKHLKWMAKFENNPQQQNPQAMPSNQMMSPQQPVMQMSQGFPVAQMLPVQSSCQTVSPMQPMGQVIDNLVSTQQAAPQASSEALIQALSQPANKEIFKTMKNRIAALLLHDLPPEVTAELRQIARELDQLNSTLT
jgi:hypothetical protein